MKAFLGSDGLSSSFLFGLVSRSLSASMFEWISWQVELLKQGFRLEGIAKHYVFAKVVLNDSSDDCYCCSDALGTFVLVFALETGLKIEWFFKVANLEWHWKRKGPAARW